jgi:ATP-dependent protease HslVU (ClpYQ) peptidase subunit
MGQLLRWSFAPPKPDTARLDRFMVTEFVDAARAALKAGGWAKKDSEQEEGGQWLVGVAGRLFEICGDYQVAEPTVGYAAIGCGGQIAHGALHATPTMPPRRRLQLALEAAAHHSAGVHGPFTYVRSRA